MVALMKSDNHIAQPQAKSNEWYTPARYIEAAREVMSGIDLDPASCELANETVRATRYYSIEDNGLSHEWHGNIWLNPPFGRTNEYKSNVKLFAEKLVDEYEYGHIEQAILLSSVRTDASWFHRLWQYPICFSREIVGFYRPERGKILKESGHFFGTCFVYLGSNEQKFIDIFSEFGTIAKRVSPPKSAPSTLWGVQK